MGKGGFFMKEFAEQFYSSTAWKKCREAFAKSKHNLCEVCAKNGIIKAGEIVHHKIVLNPVNINNPSITLDWNNLELVCRDCHAQIHSKPKRYTLDEYGRVVLPHSDTHYI